jgi:hypothetical protein
MRKRIVLTCAAAVAALAAAGCGEKKESEGPADSGAAPATQGSGADAPKASVKFASPKDGATVGSKFTAKVKLKNFAIDPAAVGKSPVPGRGHLHFQMDGGRFDVPEYSGPNGKLAKKLGVDGKYSPATEAAITYSKIPPGKHKLEVYLANNNHTDTGVEAETEFTVK